MRRFLFVTRKFPPAVGGMETLASGVWRTLEAAAPDALLPDLRDTGALVAAVHGR